MQNGNPIFQSSPEDELPDSVRQKAQEADRRLLERWMKLTPEERAAARLRQIAAATKWEEENPNLFD